MQRLEIGIFITCLYCFPFVYFSMYQDYANGSMLGYLFMIVVTVLLAFLSKFINSFAPLIIGNIASLIVSYYFVGQMSGGERWSNYFSPLIPFQLLIVVSVLNLIPQCIAIMLGNALKKRVK